MAQLAPPADLDDSCIMTLNDTKYVVTAQELKRVKEIGRGKYGIVVIMKHIPSTFNLAVKQVHVMGRDRQPRQSVVELRELLKSGQSPYIVTFYGAIFRHGDVWICMELVEALQYMKEELNLVHRDVKPRNILINRKGEIKLSDFGISGHLDGSVEKTMLYGACKPYMAPERINLNPMSTSKAAYDAWSDVWSLGIIMVEVATGTHPYSKWYDPLKQLKQVVEEEPPKLPKTTTVGQEFSEKFHDFLDKCLRKDYQSRATYTQLQKHAWYNVGKETTDAVVAAFIEQVMPIVPDQFIVGVLKMLEEDDR